MIGGKKQTNQSILLALAFYAMAFKTSAAELRCLLPGRSGCNSHLHIAVLSFIHANKRKRSISESNISSYFVLLDRPDDYMITIQTKTSMRNSIPNLLYSKTQWRLV